MEFPDGTVKEGFFENNVFVGKAYNLGGKKEESFSERAASQIRDSQTGLSLETTPVRNSTKQPLPLNQEQAQQVPPSRGSGFSLRVNNAKLKPVKPPQNLQGSQEYYTDNGGSPNSDTESKISHLPTSKGYQSSTSAQNSAAKYFSRQMKPISRELNNNTAMVGRLRRG